MRKKLIAGSAALCVAGLLSAGVAAWNAAGASMSFRGIRAPTHQTAFRGFRAPTKF